MTPQEKKPDAAKQDNDNLDEALEESFPASDPPSMTQPKPHADKPKAPPPPDDDDDLTLVDLYEDEDK